MLQVRMEKQAHVVLYAGTPSSFFWLRSSYFGSAPAERLTFIPATRSNAAARSRRQGRAERARRVALTVASTGGTLIAHGCETRSMGKDDAGRR